MDNFQFQEGVSDNVFVPYVVTPLNDLEILNLNESIDPHLQKLFVSVGNANLHSTNTNVAAQIQANFNSQVRLCFEFRSLLWL